MNKTPFQIALDVKEHLIQLAVDDKLPMDLNELDETALAEIIGKGLPTAREKAIEAAGHYLCDDGTTTIEQQVEAIANHENDFDYIDNVEGVIVWEAVQNRFDCGEFLDLIGW